MNASSWAAVEPASRMWYPETDTGCQRGSSARVKRIRSVTSRTDGTGGKMYSFWAWNSLRMSFWMVPPSAARGMPRRSAIATYIAITVAAGPLMVIEVVTAAEVDLGKQLVHVGQRVDGHAGPADLADRPRVVGVAAHQRRHVEGRREPGDARGQQVVEAPVGVGRRPNPANMRIVQSLSRYMLWYGPRVNGSTPGAPSSATP